jgi:hypothetical protein
MARFLWLSGESLQNDDAMVAPGLDPGSQTRRLNRFLS